MGKRRRRSSRDSFWMQQYGGMPVWGLAAAVVFLIGAAAVAIPASVNADRTIDPAATPRPVASFNFDRTPSPEATALPTVTVQRSDDPLRVLFIGDSLNASLHASTEAAGFRPVMVASFEESGEVEETRGARSYGTASEVSDVVDIGEGQDLAIVELGTNDYNRTSIPDFTTDYRNILATIQETSPDVELVCAGAWQPTQYAIPFDRVIKSECEAAGGAYRRLSDLHDQQRFRGPEGKTDVVGGPSDNFHPNDDGYAAIAERLLGAVTIR